MKLLPEKAQKIACQGPINKPNTAKYKEWQWNPRWIANARNQLNSRQQQAACKSQVVTFIQQQEMFNIINFIPTKWKIFLNNVKTGGWHTA